MKERVRAFALAAYFSAGGGLTRRSAARDGRSMNGKTEGERPAARRRVEREQPEAKLSPRERVLAAVKIAIAHQADSILDLRSVRLLEERFAELDAIELSISSSSVNDLEKTLQRSHFAYSDRSYQLVRSYIAEVAYLLARVGESNKSGYTGDNPSSRPADTPQQSWMGDAETITDDELFAFVRKIPNGKRGAVRDVLQAAAGETTERAPAGLRAASMRARRESRAVTAQQDWQPPSVRLPAGLQWPREQFEGSPEYQKTGGIVRHLDRVWKPLIAAGVIDMALLRNFYPSTARGIDRFKHNNGGEPRSLGDLDIRLLKAGSGRRRRVAALEHA